MNMTKKIIAIVSVLFILCAAWNIKGVNAFLADDDVLLNEVKIGSVGTEIIEENDTKIIVPGETFRKVVQVKNVGGSRCYVRVKVLVSPEEYTDELSLNINKIDWHYQDGYYYYKHSLNCNEITSPLFTQLVIPSTLGNGDVFDINVYSEGVQTLNNNINDNVVTENYLEIFEKITN